MPSKRSAKTSPHPRLRNARIAAGYASAAEFARAADVEDGGYRHHENGTRPLTAEAAQKYAPTLNCSWVWLFTGDHGEAPQPAHPLVSPPAVFEDETNRPSLEDMGFVLINAYDASLSAGHGVINAPQILPDHKVAFRLDWVRSRTSAAIERLGVLRVSGHSMVPDLHSGDTVLVDMSVTDVRRDGMYAVSYRDGDEAMVKNIQRDPRNGKLIIKSSNVADFPPIPDVEDDRLIIWGRVLWVGRNIE